MITEKIWANSGDSHFIEPSEAWKELPTALRERMPRSVKDPGGDFETVYVDGRSFQRKLPSLRQQEVFLPTKPPNFVEDYHYESWEPLWAACEEANMVVSFHIGTDPIDLEAGDELGVVFRGPGGAVMNHTDNTIMGQRAVMKLTASGALDRHPDLKVLVSEGGATWVPLLGDRMNEAYRQHHMRVRPKLSMLPKEFLYRQVYASFQHDESAVAAVTAMGYRNVMWGSDYPHLEGTFGHTQETLHYLFDGVDAETRDRITVGSFLDLFPEAGPPPALRNEA